MVEDHFLIEVLELGAHPNTSWTVRSAATSASTSSRVLYSASDARAVAGTPRRAINGWQQWWPGTDGDALAVENRADVVRMHVVRERMTAPKPWPAPCRSAAGPGTSDSALGARTRAASSSYAATRSMPMAVR